MPLRDFGTAYQCRTPVVHRGDVTCAERRYPGTSIPLEELTREAFDAALHLLRVGCRGLIGTSRRTFTDWPSGMSAVGILAGVQERGGRDV